MSDNEIKWDKQVIGPGLLHNYLNRALDEILSGVGFLPDSHVPNGMVKGYAEQAVLFGDKGCQDALVANLRNAVFNFLNEE